jgi:hypothetical protein
MARRDWNSLSTGYRDRLIREGVTQERHADPNFAIGKTGINVLTTQGLQRLELNARDRSMVARHWNALEHYMEGRRDDMDEFEGKTLRGGYVLETDLGRLWMMSQDNDGPLSIPSIYEKVT